MSFLGFKPSKHFLKVRIKFEGFPLGISNKIGSALNHRRTPQCRALNQKEIYFCLTTVTSRGYQPRASSRDPDVTLLLLHCVKLLFLKTHHSPR